MCFDLTQLVTWVSHPIQTCCLISLFDIIVRYLQHHLQLLPNEKEGFKERKLGLPCYLPCTFLAPS